MLFCRGLISLAVVGGAMTLLLSGRKLASKTGVVMAMAEGEAGGLMVEAETSLSVEETE